MTVKITKIFLDEFGRICVQPKKMNFDQVYRGTMGIYWNKDGKYFYPMKIGDWGHYNWFVQIVLAAKQEYGCHMKLSRKTQFIGIDDQTKADIVDALRTETTAPWKIKFKDWLYISIIILTFPISIPILIITNYFRTMKNTYKFLIKKGFIYSEKEFSKNWFSGKGYHFTLGKVDIAILVGSEYRDGTLYEICLNYNSDNPQYLPIYNTEIGSEYERKKLADSYSGFDADKLHIEFLKKHINDILSLV